MENVSCRKLDQTILFPESPQLTKQRTLIYYDQVHIAQVTLTRPVNVYFTRIRLQILLMKNMYVYHGNLTSTYCYYIYVLTTIWWTNCCFTRVYQTNRVGESVQHVAEQWAFHLRSDESPKEVRKWLHC